MTLDLQTVLAVYLALTQLGDYLTTTYVLDRGGRESNPLMNKLFGIFGVRPTLIVKGIFVVVLCYTDLLAMMIVSVIYTAVVGWNLLQIRKLKH